MAGFETMPDEGYNLRTRAGRLQAAEAIAERCRAIGAQVAIENWDGDPDVDITVASLHAQIWLAWTPLAPMPLISWYGAKYPLVGVLAAWHGLDVNPCHRRKATRLPSTWPELFDMLETGLLAAIDGSAFDLAAA